MDNIGIISNNDNSKALNIAKDIYDYLVSDAVHFNRYEGKNAFASDTLD